MKKTLDLKSMSIYEIPMRIANELFQIYRRERGSLANIFDLLADHRVILEFYRKPCIRKKKYVFSVRGEYTHFTEAVTDLHHYLGKGRTFYLVSLSASKATFEPICKRNKDLFPYK